MAFAAVALAAVLVTAPVSRGADRSASSKTVAEVGDAYLDFLKRDSLYLRMKFGLPIDRLPDISLAKEATAGANEPENVRQFLRVDPMEIEIGYMLIPLTDAEQDGTLLGRVTVIRRQMALELGIILPTIRVRDNAQIDPNSYVIKLRGVQVATGEVRPNRLMAMNPGLAEQEIDGIPAVEPAFGLPAIWIAPEEQERAEMLGYTVVDAVTVAATHLTEMLRAAAPDLLGRREAQELFEIFARREAKLVDEVIPNVLPLGDVLTVLRQLLRESVPIRDLRTIFETLADGGELEWGEVTAYAPGELFSMLWSMGRPAPQRTDVSVRFDPLGPEICRVTLTHENWERMGEEAERLRSGYNNGWASVFEQCYADYAGRL